MDNIKVNSIYTNPFFTLLLYLKLTLFKDIRNLKTLSLRSIFY